MNTTQMLIWSDQLVTGLDEVDDEHKRLIGIINELIKLHGQKTTAEKVQSALAELRSYSVYHFKHEEEITDSFPVNEANKAANVRAHHGFIEHLKRAENWAVTHPDDAVDNLLAYLVKWLVHHITGVDARLTREILAIRAGNTSELRKIQENTLYDTLVNTVSYLYESMGDRTFEMLELNQKLQDYHDKQEEENAFAQDLILRLMQRGELSNSQLSYWFLPTDVFSGDIISAMSGPKGEIYALLADATGHGLAAAITVLPVLTEFNAMAQRGLPLSDILSEINLHLRATLPRGRFVAATLLCVKGAEKTAEVWVGGMPGVLLIGSDGQLAQKLTSTQLPLGIIDSDAKMFATTTVTWEAGSQFVIYSDGLTEAENMSGEPFGEERIIEAILRCAPDDRMAEVQNALASHMGLALQQDDISLLLMDCRDL